MSSFTSVSKKSRVRRKTQGRLEKGGFLALPHSIIRSQQFGRLNPWALKLLLELASAYRGSNNGDLSAAFSMLRLRGWKSPGTLAGAKKELVEAGWIVTTRQGGRNRCSLYAVTWWSIDECSGKTEVSAEKTARNDWRK